MAVHKTYSSQKEIAEIWKLFRETDRTIKNMSKETDRRMQETDRRMQETDRRMQETDRRMQETDRRMQETDRQMKETDHRIKKLNDLFTGQWGKLMESLVEGDLVKLLKERQIKVEATLTSLKGEYDGEYAEFDIVAVNGEEIVVVEVKTTLTISHINDFTKKLKKFTKWRPEYSGKKVYGAMAYLKANQNSNKYAEKQKLFVIRATGSSACITNSKNFKPKIFS